MIRMHRFWERRPASRLAFLVSLAAAPLAAQDSTLVIDFGVPVTRPERSAGIPDSVLQRALTIFNAPPPATSRSFGGTTQVVARHGGNYGMFGGDLLVRALIEGDVVVINGDLRVTAEGRITGRVIVLGGRYSADSGAVVSGRVTEFRTTAAVRRTAEGTLEPAEPALSLRDLAGRASLRIGAAVLSPRLGLGTYNRVEGFPLGVGGRLAFPDPTGVQFTLDADLILRTARDPSSVRDPIGWRGRLTARLPDSSSVMFGIEAGHHIVATEDRPYSDTESALSAFLLKRDYRDWFSSRDAALFATWKPRADLRLAGRVGVSRERSVAAVDAFSLLRGSEPWRSNPLVDDGHFVHIEVAAAWDSRREPSRPSNGWTVSASLRRNSSDELTPVSLPEQVRDQPPSSGYESWEATFLIGREQRLNPATTLRAQIAGSGWLGGDPLTIQRRLALGGGGGLAGYTFREIGCDPQRQAAAVKAALCDRRITAQVELRRTTGIRLGTNFGPYAVGIDRPDLVLFGDLGSAWLAGDGPGQVPSDRIQSLSEWRGDVGLGLDAGWVGVYFARSFTDERPIRAVIRLQQRF